MNYNATDKQSNLRINNRLDIPENTLKKVKIPTNPKIG